MHITLMQIETKKKLKDLSAGSGLNTHKLDFDERVPQQGEETYALNNF